MSADHPAFTPRANVIFDFDLTILPEESTHRLAHTAIRGHSQLNEFLENFQLKNKSSREKFSDAFNFIRVVTKIKKATIRECIDQLRPKIDPVFGALFSELKSAGIKPHIISSGYFEVISPLLNELGIPNQDIAANRFLWLGNQAIFIAPSPLHGSKGKVALINGWKSSGKLVGPVVMIGDGQPDRNVFSNGMADGFIQANYYINPVNPNLSGNFSIAETPASLSEHIHELLSPYLPDTRMSVKAA